MTVGLRDGAGPLPSSATYEFGKVDNVYASQSTAGQGLAWWWLLSGALVLAALVAPLVGYSETVVMPLGESAGNAQVVAGEAVPGDLDADGTPAQEGSAPEHEHPDAAGGEASEGASVSGVDVEPDMSVPVARVQPRRRAQTRRRKSERPPLSARSEVSLVRASASGGLSSGELRSAFAQALPRLRACHNKELRRGAKVSGTVRAHAALRSRQVESIDIRTSLPSVSLRACLREALVSVRLPTMADGAFADARLEFFVLARPEAR
jgi:hypothetical protein